VKRAHVLALVVGGLHWIVPAWVPPALAQAVTEHRADVALVVAVCAQESSLGRAGVPLCGAHGRGVGADALSQARVAARAFPASATRAQWRRRLVSWRCGGAVECRATLGAGYASRVLALRDRLARVAP
jgi:hypothetical protein